MSDPSCLSGHRPYYSDSAAILQEPFSKASTIHTPVNHLQSKHLSFQSQMLRPACFKKVITLGRSQGRALEENGSEFTHIARDSRLTGIFCSRFFFLGRYKHLRAFTIQRPSRQESSNVLWLARLLANQQSSFNIGLKAPGTWSSSCE